MNRYRVVSSTAIQYRNFGVLTSAYFGEVVSLNPGDARRLTAEGAVVPVEDPAPGATS